MKRIILLTGLIFSIGISIKAQNIERQILSAGGHRHSSSQGELQWTLGELATEMFSGEMMLTQGFHQTYYWLTSVEGKADVSLGISPYPNPTHRFVHLETGDSKIVSAAVFDLNGRQWLQTRLESPVHRLDLRDLPEGTLLLKLTSESGRFQTFKIQKMSF